jgi:GTPase SAR1 family protein
MIARKVMLLGEIGVGKSSLARRLMLDKFDFDYKPTIGVDVYRFEVEATALRPAMALIIWDTDGNFGEALFKHIYMKEAAAALIIGDLGRAPTLDTMVKLGQGFADAFPGRQIGYVVNKADLALEPEAVPLPAGLMQPGIALTRSSAKTGLRVREAFVHAADSIARRGL